MYRSQTVKSHIKHVLSISDGPCTLDLIEGVLEEYDSFYKGVNILGELNELHRKREISRDIRYWTHDDGRMEWIYVFRL